MSIEAVDWARTVATGSPARKVVLLVLADHADHMDHAYISIRKLALLTEQSHRSVERVLARLAQDGYIRRHARYDAETGARIVDEIVLCIPSTHSRVG